MAALLGEVESHPFQANKPLPTLLRCTQTSCLFVRPTLSVILLKIALQLTVGMYTGRETADDQRESYTAAVM